MFGNSPIYPSSVMALINTSITPDSHQTHDLQEELSAATELTKYVHVTGPSHYEKHTIWQVPGNHRTLSYSSKQTSFHHCVLQYVDLFLVGYIWFDQWLRICVSHKSKDQTYTGGRLLWKLTIFSSLAILLCLSWLLVFVWWSLYHFMQKCGR